MHHRNRLKGKLDKQIGPKTSSLFNFHLETRLLCRNPSAQCLMFIGKSLKFDLACFCDFTCLLHCYVAVGFTDFGGFFSHFKLIAIIIIQMKTDGFITKMYFQRFIVLRKKDRHFDHKKYYILQVSIWHQPMQINVCSTSDRKKKKFWETTKWKT